MRTIWRRNAPGHFSVGLTYLRPVGTTFSRFYIHLLIWTLAFGCAGNHLDTAVARRYWWVPLDSLAIGHTTHTHVRVHGNVTLVRTEADGDVHIRLSAPSGRFIVAECIPRLPCRRPKLGDTLTVSGISRRDAEHAWWEVHPVESIP